MRPEIIGLGGRTLLESVADLRRNMQRRTKNGSNKYFYAKDYLSSVRELTDISGVIQALYQFDSYGRTRKLQGSSERDFKYAAYYFHSRSALSVTRPVHAALFWEDSFLAISCLRKIPTAAQIDLIMCSIIL